MQVEHIRLTLGLKAKHLVCQPVEKYISLSNFMVSDDVNLHPYIESLEALNPTPPGQALPVRRRRCKLDPGV